MSTGLNPLGETAVLPTFQTQARPDVFSFGDVTSLCENKQAITLVDKAPTVVHNLMAVMNQLANGGDAAKTPGLRSYRITDKGHLYLPFGPKDGASFVPGFAGMRVTKGDKYTSDVKGMDLFTTKFWRIATGSNPGATVEADFSSSAVSAPAT